VLIYGIKKFISDERVYINFFIGAERVPEAEKRGTA